MIPSNYASPGRSEHAVCAVRSFTFFGVGIPGRAHVDIHTGFYAAPAGSLAVRLADGRPRVELTARSGAAPFAVEPVHRTYGRRRCRIARLAKSHGRTGPGTPQTRTGNSERCQPVETRDEKSNSAESGAGRGQRRTSRLATRDTSRHMPAIGAFCTRQHVKYAAGSLPALFCSRMTRRGSASCARRE